jgi:hypothetical protein
MFIQITVKDIAATKWSHLWRTVITNCRAYLSIYLSIYLYPCCPHLEHRASVKCFVSLQYLNLRVSVGLLERGISPSQCCYLRRIIQTHNKRTGIHALSRIWTHDPRVRAAEDISCLRPRDYCDRRRAHNLFNFVVNLECRTVIWIGYMSRKSLDLSYTHKMLDVLASVGIYIFGVCCVKYKFNHGRRLGGKGGKTGICSPHSIFVQNENCRKEINTKYEDQNVCFKSLMFCIRKGNA